MSLKAGVDDMVTLGLSIMARTSLEKVEHCRGVVNDILQGGPFAAEASIVVPRCEGISATGYVYEGVCDTSVNLDLDVDAVKSVCLALCNFELAVSVHVKREEVENGVRKDYERLLAELWVLGVEGTVPSPIEAISSSDDAYDALNILAVFGLMSKDLDCVRPYEAEVRRLAGFFDERDDPRVKARSRRRARKKR